MTRLVDYGHVGVAGLPTKLAERFGVEQSVLEHLRDERRVVYGVRERRDVLVS